MTWWMWLAYFAVGIVAARAVRRRVPATKVIGVYDKHRHGFYCDVQYGRKRCDCGRGRQGHATTLASGAVATVLAAIPFWPLALLIAVIFLDPPRRKPLVTVEEIERLEREAGMS